jgi:hypothetical protein
MNHDARHWPKTAQGPAGGATEQSWERPLRDSFDGPDFSPDGGLYYRDNFEQSAGTCAFQKDVKLSGAGALKLSVRAIEPVADSNHSERAEVWEKTGLRVPYGVGVWYGFAVKFADPIPSDDHRYVIAQWKREIDPGADGNFSPFLALRLKNGKLYATVETNYIAPGLADRHDADALPTFFRPHANQMRTLVAADPSWTTDDNSLFAGFTTAISVADHGNRLPRPSSGWMDFVIYAKPGPDGTGHVEIIANGKPVVTVKGPIGHAGKGLGKRQYFKFGPYRAGHTNEWTLYYDDFRRSPVKSDVVR